MRSCTIPLAILALWWLPGPGQAQYAPAYYPYGAYPQYGQYPQYVPGYYGYTAPYAYPAPGYAGYPGGYSAPAGYGYSAAPNGYATPAVSGTNAPQAPAATSAAPAVMNLPTNGPAIQEQAPRSAEEETRAASPVPAPLPQVQPASPAPQSQQAIPALQPTQPDLTPLPVREVSRPTAPVPVKTVEILKSLPTPNEPEVAPPPTPASEKAPRDLGKFSRDRNKLEVRESAGPVIEVPTMAEAVRPVPLPIQTVPTDKKEILLPDPWHTGPGHLGGTDGYFPGQDDNHGSFVAGAGFYILRPFFNNNAAYTTTYTTLIPGVGVANTTTTNTTQQNFQDNYTFAPLVWLGYVSRSGLGVRARYWYYQNTATTTTTNDVFPTGTTATVITSSGTPPFFVTSGNPGSALSNGVGQDQLQFTRSLRLNVWDMEAIQQLNSGPWSLLVGAGARYATLNQSYGATRFNPGGSNAAGTTTFDLDFETASSVNNFKGAGPMAVLEAYRTLGNTGLAIYGSARGSVLFGTHRMPMSHTQLEDGTLAGATIGFATFDSSSLNSYGVLPVGEVELGGLYYRDIGSFRVFVRPAAVGQVWWNAGTATSRTGDLGFLGGTLAFGVQY